MRVFAHYEHHHLIYPRTFQVSAFSSDLPQLRMRGRQHRRPLWQHLRLQEELHPSLADLDADQPNKRHLDHPRAWVRPQLLLLSRRGRRTVPLKQRGYPLLLCLQLRLHHWRRRQERSPHPGWPIPLIRQVMLEYRRPKDRNGWLHLYGCNRHKEDLKPDVKRDGEKE